MEVIGIGGGIASGKSTVAAELAALGAVVLDADQAAHDALRQPEVKQALVKRWGESIISASGEPDRQAIAERVFPSADAENHELQFLENLLHPLVRCDFEDKLCKLDKIETLAAVIDAPLLLEAGWGDLCDFLIFVESSDQNRAERISPRDWSSGELTRREAAQMPIDEKRRRATHVIRNLGSREDLRAEVQAFWDANIPIGP
jgi:dephospho-CoA kinase